MKEIKINVEIGSNRENINGKGFWDKNKYS